MNVTAGGRIDWRALWRAGDLQRFCFVSLGILLHATNETMMSTVMPSMVRDLAGVELVGWSFAIYEIGSIVAGALAGRLVSYVSLRLNMSGAAMLYGAGALLCAAAPSMQWFLAGRLIEGFGGGALVALAYVSVERLFPPRIWPQLFAVMSAVWGVSAFSGPLIGALIIQVATWRTAFACFAVAGTAMAIVSYIVLSGKGAERPTDRMASPFPLLPLAVLAAGVMLIAYAGVGVAVRSSALLLGLGLAALAAFFVLDDRRPASRLFPAGVFDWGTPLGTGLIMVAAFSTATSSFALYAPLLLTTLNGVPVLTTGYIIAAESIAWSVLSILVANIRPENERPIVLAGGLMVTAGVAGFAYAIPAGMIPLVLACAILQGGGFGIAWPFVTRMIVASAAEGERAVASSAVPTMQRIGYAVGAALAGLIANAAGFDRGLDADTSAAVASGLFLAFVPIAIIGCAAALRLVLMRRGAAR